MLLCSCSSRKEEKCEQTNGGLAGGYVVCWTIEQEDPYPDTVRKSAVLSPFWCYVQDPLGLVQDPLRHRMVGQTHICIPALCDRSSSCNCTVGGQANPRVVGNLRLGFFVIGSVAVSLDSQDPPYRSYVGTASHVISSDALARI